MSRKFHVQRFEDKLSPGIPDTMACGRGICAFIEGKFIQSFPARDNTFIRFGSKGEDRLAHQCNWLTAHDKAGGLALWWVRVGDGGWYLFDKHYDWIRDGIPRWRFEGTRRYSSARTMVEGIDKMMKDHAEHRPDFYGGIDGR